jgi:micrococcal nuclease
VVVVVALGGACGIGDMEAKQEPAPPGTARVVRPVDGDTIVVDIGGDEESVRLIGIDTPESVAQDRPVECFGPEAKARTAELLPEGTLVRLERDVEARDRYDRLLAYVLRDADDVFVNELLVDEGFAESIAYPPNTARQGDLDAAEARARADGRGLWSACGGTDVPIEPG